MKKNILLVAITTVSLAACGSLNKIDNDGNVIGEMKWHDNSQTTFPTTRGQQTGFYPADEDMLSIQLGMSKAAVFQKFGHPHFDEGFFRVREWTYLHDRVTSEGLKQCQFKFIFDSNNNVKSFHWQDTTCAIEVKKPAPVQPAPNNPIQEPVNLSGDFTFEFDSAVLSARGRSELDNLIARMNQATADGYQFKQVGIVGHTDRLGDAGYNQNLSQQRAISVARYLTENGNIPINVMQAWGAGESEPVKECEGTRSTPALKACLEPNRRVVITVN